VTVNWSGINEDAARQKYPAIVNPNARTSITDHIVRETAGKNIRFHSSLRKKQRNAAAFLNNAEVLLRCTLAVRKIDRTTMSSHHTGRKIAEPKERGNIPPRLRHRDRTPVTNRGIKLTTQ
jgi:hypothetical protein